MNYQCIAIQAYFIRMFIMSDNKDKEFENALKELLTDMVNKIEDKSLIDGTYKIQRN